MQVIEKFNKVVVLGSGSWGTALGSIIANNKIPVTLWGRDIKVVEEINEKHTNTRYLPRVKLPYSLKASNNLDCVIDSELIILATPSQSITDVLSRVKESLSKSSFDKAKNLIYLSCIKGIEKNSGLCMSEIIRKKFPDNNVAVLTGPSHAEEVCKKMPTAVVIGCEKLHIALKLQKLFTLKWFRSYSSDDIIGLEIAGALKNVFAIASGICVGLGLGDNARSALITRGLAEIIRIGTALGGKLESFIGLGGVGDLIVTCYSLHSRNFKVGNLIGSGLTAEQATKKIKMVAEGVPNTKNIYDLARRLDVETPLINETYNIIFKGKDPKVSLSHLLSREPKKEFK